MSREDFLTKRLADRSEENERLKNALRRLLEWNEGIQAGRGNHHPVDHIKVIRDALNI